MREIHGSQLHVVFGVSTTGGVSLSENGRTWLETMGAQVTCLFATSPRSSTSVDDGGWLGLSGEPVADLNMGCVLAGEGSSALLRQYIESANRSDVPLILMLESPSDELLAEANLLGATYVGDIPVMVWHNGPIPETDNVVTARIAVNDFEKAAAIEVMADAFSVDLESSRTVFRPILESPDVTCWIWEEENVVAAAGFGVRSEDIAGIYCMATLERFQRRGAGRSVLSSMMSDYLNKGVDHFYLGATPAGFHLYEQLGYKTVTEPAALVVGTSTQFQ